MRVSALSGILALHVPMSLTRNLFQRPPAISRFGGEPRGFALVVTLALMLLLSLLAVGLLSLSSISLRSTSQGEAVAVARANARLALMLAFGELQKQAGIDTRVTARADVLAPENPPVLGVWKSWQGSDHETTGSFAGRPISPGNYRTEKKNRFVAWLTSANKNDSATVPDTKAGTAKVAVVGTGSVGTGTGSEGRQIHLLPTAVTTERQLGSIAWWIGGENQKARLPRSYKPDSNTAARWAVHAKSHAVADTEPFRVEMLLEDSSPADKAVTLRQVDLIADKGKSTTTAAREFFHDLTTVSVGLLTNTATGAWRKDLSLLTEKWESQPTSNLPLFRLTPRVDAKFTRPVPGSAMPANSMANQNRSPIR